MAFVTALRRLSLASPGAQRHWRTAAAAPSLTSWTTAAAAAACTRRSFAGTTAPLRSDNKVTVHFVDRDGEKKTVKGSPGDSLLDVVINEDLDIDGFGACEGTLACSTCHVILDEDVYKTLGRITDEEMDMLDLAYGLTDTSRLGCQICLTKALDGIVVKVPDSVADVRQSQDGSS